MSAAGTCRWVWIMALLAGIGLLAPEPVLAEGVGHVNFLLGQKSLDEDDWAPVEDQAEFGAEITWGKKDWPILIATDIASTSDEQKESDPFLGDVTVEGSTWELSLGVRKVWETGIVRPYVGGGLAFVGAEAKVTLLGVSAQEDDNAVGGWVGGGVFWRLGSRFNLGVSARFSKATVSLSGVDAEAGGLQGGLILGWGWPASK